MLDSMLFPNDCFSVQLPRQSLNFYHQKTFKNADILSTYPVRGLQTICKMKAYKLLLTIFKASFFICIICPLKLWKNNVHNEEEQRLRIPCVTGTIDQRACIQPVSDHFKVRLQRLGKKCAASLRHSLIEIF